MTRVLVTLMCALTLPIAVVAQDDDMYFGKKRRQATKVTIVDAKDTRVATYEYRATPKHRKNDVRDVDEYNRRHHRSSESANYGYEDNSQTTYYYESSDRSAYDNNEEYCYSIRLSRFYSPGFTISIGSPWYDNYWLGYYDPFWDVSYWPSWYSHYYTPWGYRFNWSRSWGRPWEYNAWIWPYYPRYEYWYGSPRRDYYRNYYSYRPRTRVPRGGTRPGFTHIANGSRIGSGTRVNTTRSTDVLRERPVTSDTYSGRSRSEGGRVITERYSNSNGRVNVGRDTSRGQSRGSGSSYNQPTRSSSSTSSTGGFSGGSRGTRR